MIEKTDKLVKLLLYSPHITDFIYQREDGSYYAHRKNHGECYQEVTNVAGEWIFGEIIK